MNEWKKKCFGLQRTWVSKRTVYCVHIIVYCDGSNRIPSCLNGKFCLYQSESILQYFKIFGTCWTSAKLSNALLSCISVSGASILVGSPTKMATMPCFLDLLVNAPLSLPMLFLFFTGLGELSARHYISGIVRHISGNVTIFKRFTTIRRHPTIYRQVSTFGGVRNSTII